jgi:hypothetical protein
MRIIIYILLLIEISTGSFLLTAQTNKSEPPPASINWLRILDSEVKANEGKIPIDNLISVVVDHEGSGKEYSVPTTEREKDYAQAFIKLRSLATSLYRTEEGRKAYLEPEFTRTFNAYSSEDDTKNYDPSPGHNGLYRMTDGRSNNQTVRVNISEKLGQMTLLTTWLIEGNPELGIPALGIQHPIVVGLLVYHMAGLEHDSFHALQYFFNPVDYLNRLVDREQPEVMNPKNPQYGLISGQLVEKARFKLFYEMDGFYISGFFRRGHEKETLAAADMIEDRRSGHESVRGLPGAGNWISKIQPYFDKGGMLEWLQDGTNNRDVVNVYLRGDAGNPESNLWFLDDEKVFPESMRGFMSTQFEPAITVCELAEINKKLAASGRLSKVQQEKIIRDVQSITQVWQSSVEAQRANGGLNSMVEEFPYLKPVIVRYEGDTTLGIQGEINKFRRLAIKRGIQ